MRQREHERLLGWLGPAGVLVWPPVALLAVALALLVAACAPARAQDRQAARVCGRIDLQTGAIETYPCPGSGEQRVEQRHPLPSPPAPNRVQVPHDGRFCHPDASELARQLEGPKWGEHKIANGRQRDGLILQIFTSPTTETWTAVTVDPFGRACIVASGDLWRAVRLQKLGPDDISARLSPMRGGGLPADAVRSNSPGLPDAAAVPGSNPGPRAIRENLPKSAGAKP
jgi:hypothetical protein